MEIHIFCSYHHGVVGRAPSFCCRGVYSKWRVTDNDAACLRTSFTLGRCDRIPNKKPIHNWVSNFKQTSSALKRTSAGRPRTATGTENVAAVKASIEQSPRCSSRKHTATLRLSDRSVQRILHKDLKMHSYKIVIAQELSERDFETHTTLCQDFLGTFAPQMLCSFWMRHISTFTAQSTNKISVTGLTLILKS